MIKENKIMCLKCNQIIESKSVHDFVTCRCGAVSVDGGLEYCKRVGDRKNWKELSVDDGLYPDGKCEFERNFMDRYL